MSNFIYVIDTCSIIDAFRLYPHDIFPRLWENLDGLIKKGRLISHRFVLEELLKKSDEASKWAKERRGMFKDITLKQTEIVKKIVSEFPELVDPDKDVDADPWLIALASEKEEQQKLVPKIGIKIIVTEEKLRQNRINIPFICREFGIEYTNLIGMMRKEGWKW